jgi:heme/copper-type cytochrome/quinol oxidase subunit 4
MNEQKMNELTRGVVVFLGLAVLTIVEYFMAISELPSVLLWIIALVKAGLVLWFFMHIYRLSGSEGGH